MTVRVALRPGFGAFAGGEVHSGTFTLSGAELSTDTCGVCVEMQVAHSEGGYDIFAPIAGTVEVQLGFDMQVELDEVRLVRTLHNLHLVPRDDCETTISHTAGSAFL